MQAGGRDAENDVALLHVGAGQRLVALHRADREAGKVVIALGVHAGHFRGLAADQGAAGLFAAVGDAGDDGAGGGDVQLAGREVVEEEQGLGALHHQVVDAHGDQVDADAVMLAGFDRDLQLGADAVGGGDQQRIAIAGRLEVEEGAEAAQAGVRTAARRRFGERLDRFHQGLAGIDVHAGFAIGQAIAGIGFAGLQRLAGYGILRGDGL